MKRMVVLLLCGALLLALSGCVSEPAQEDLPPETGQETEEPSETQPTVPEDSEDSTEEPVQEPNPDQESTPVQDTEPAPTEEPEDQTEPEQVDVTIYYGDDNCEYLLSEETQIPELDPQALADLLYDKGVFSHRFVVNSCKVEEGLIELDLDEHFEEMLQSTGTSGEYIMMGSLVNTFLDAYEADELRLTVEGETLETGHSIYDWNLTFYES